MSVVELLIVSALALLAYLTVVWLTSLGLRNAGVIDIAWGLGFVLLAALYFGLTDGYVGRKILILCLVSIWGIRLSAHLFLRSRGEPEDFRYRELHNEHPEQFWWRSYLIFLGQGFGGLLLVSLPLLAAQYEDTPGHLTLLDAAGTAVWLFGFAFEAAGDRQLTQFKTDPANSGKVMDRGLWHYTRHPNYFGDATLWWGYYLIALSTPGGWVTIVSPVIMTLILLRLSGIGTMEPHLRNTKPGYAKYVTSTSAFIPWPAGKRTTGAGPETLDQFSDGR